jgi:hypothetical protein
MSLLSSFLASNIIPALESAFVAHEPAMQATLLAEVQTLLLDVNNWLTGKVNTANAQTEDKAL